MNKLNELVSNMNLTLLIDELEDKSNTTNTINGIIKGGIQRKIPLTCINFQHQNYKEIILLLIKHGADVNRVDANGNTLLTHFFTQLYDNWNDIVKSSILDTLSFLLKRGCNPDGTLFHNPLCIILLLIKKKDIRNDKHLILRIVDILMVFQTNPLTTIIIPRTSVKNQQLSPVDLIPPIFFKNSIYHEIKKIFLNTTYLKSGTIKTTPIDRDIKIANEDLLCGHSVYSFDKTEILFYTEKDIIYCFHVSEVPFLLTTGKNPFTQVLFPETFKNTLISTDYYPIKNRLSYEKQEIRISDVLNYLEVQLKTFDSYIDLKKILDLNLKELVSLKDIIYEKVRNNQPHDVYTNNKTEIIIHILTIILIILKNNDNSIPTICLILENTFFESTISHSILSLFPVYSQHDVCHYIVSHTFQEFLNKCEDFIQTVSTDNAMQTQTIDNFFMYIEDNKEQEEWTDREIFKLYKTFIYINITEILEIDNEKVDQEEMETIWKDVSVIFNKYL